ncbi:MAG: TlpA disulfide reductase family protein [Deltaproteobacteria bacterium]
MRRAALLLTLASACATSSNAGPALPEGPVALRLIGADGAPLNVAGLRGKVVIVSIFGTWSDPALVELRLFETMRERWQEDVEVVCAIVEEDQQMVRIFEDTFEFPFHVGRVEDPRAFTSQFGPFGPISVSPTSVLLDKRGHIAARMDGMWPPEVLTEALETLVARPD